jgi:hypothetical protein
MVNCTNIDNLNICRLEKIKYTYKPPDKPIGLLHFFGGMKYPA